MSNHILVTTTSDQVDVLKKIARQLVLEHLAACVQISQPINSVYSWDGKVESVEERTCTAKTTQAAFERVQQTILEMHNYDEPEVIATPIIDGSETYLQWLEETVSGALDQ